MEAFPERLQRRQQCRLLKRKPRENRQDGGTSPSNSRDFKPLNIDEEDAATPSGTSQGTESCRADWL
ncbi:hypothetical protein OsI_27793 [Oryza sativa Indica Group]|uniref:Uncharacterized protein n=1 Tax=Oryza sativa subsp. indica TaxID=39946 RepID=A2YR67_ORYSI|nr:hypothetical protein OsI_27793 [Oryza sativa Indica Group]